jgi:hypothetical protein
MVLFLNDKECFDTNLYVDIVNLVCVVILIACRLGAYLVDVGFYFKSIFLLNEYCFGIF